MNYKRHPISAAFPDLSSEELSDLRASIRALGVLEPVILFEGKVLDGWQRYTVARRLGVSCRFERFTGTRREAVELAVAKQVRRNMTKTERATVLVRLHAGQLAPRGNHSKSASVADFVTLKELAIQSGISERTLGRARQLQERAIESVRIVHEKGLITAEEAEQLSSYPLKQQRRELNELLDTKRWSRKPGDVHGCVRLDGKFFPPPSVRDRWLGKQLCGAVPELSALISSGKNVGLVAAAAVARRPPDEQRSIIASWSSFLRPLPSSRFERRQLRRNPAYFALG